MAGKRRQFRAMTLVAAGLFALPVAALAQDNGEETAPAPGQNAPGKPQVKIPADIDRSRYALAPMDGGVARLDRHTGAMSYCTLQSGLFVCRPAADERQAYEAEIDRLHKRLDAFEQNQAGKPESEKDRKVREAMRHAGRALRRFYDAIQNLGTEMENGWQEQR